MNIVLPKNWSELTWQQLCNVWMMKQRYGGNADIARCAALLDICGLRVCRSQTEAFSSDTGEQTYTIADKEGHLFTVNPRQLSHIASCLSWIDYPYGDPGEKEEKDEKGKVVKEKRKGHQGYVNPVNEWRDAMSLPEETIAIDGMVFALPQIALVNVTWQQYRTLQALVPQIFREGITEEQAITIQAQFLAHCLVPGRASTVSTDRFAPPHEFRYNADRAEQTVSFWKQYIQAGTPLFHICFQVYQTAMGYYSAVYYDLFNGSGRQPVLHTALSGEVGTLNAVMKYAGYASPQEVYDANLPIVFDVLNTMSKEAKEVEKMNAKMKKR